MIVPLNDSTAQFEVKSSRFIARIQAIENQDEVKAIVSALREENPTVTHVVWAYVWGKDASVYGYSDDREPKGTAGRPVFEVVKGSGVTNVLVTVLRYFGGTKLGTGGLARAYAESVKMAMAGLKTGELIEMNSWQIGIDYSVYEKACLLTRDLGGNVLKETFDSRVTLEVEVPEKAGNEWVTSMENLCSGRCEISAL